MHAVETRIIRSARQTGERTETPERCGAEGYKKAHTGQTARSGAIAPTVEHGSESSEKEDDRGYPKSF